MAFGLWALGFGLWALDFGLWALGFGLWGLGIRHWAYPWASTRRPAALLPAAGRLRTTGHPPRAGSRQAAAGAAPRVDARGGGSTDDTARAHPNTSSPPAPARVAAAFARKRPRARGCAWNLALGGPALAMTRSAAVRQPCAARRYYRLWYGSFWRACAADSCRRRVSGIAGAQRRLSAAGAQRSEREWRCDSTRGRTRSPWRGETADHPAR